MDSMKTKELLSQAYLNILKNAPLESLYTEVALSGIFLASPSEAYFSSPKKLMVVGQETRSWRNKECKIKNSNDLSQAAILETMEASEIFNKKKPKNSKFRQSYKKASNIICSQSSSPAESAVWANQFCISKKRGSPTKSQNFDIIQNISHKILKAQIDILKPDVALFFTGADRDKFLKSCFPNYKTIDIIEPRRLWKFKINDTICYRTNHPRWGESGSYINKAIKLASQPHNDWN